MGSMQEQITTTKKGSIPSVQAIYVHTDDLADPYPATTVFPRPFAEHGIYPAVDPLDSTSSVMNLTVIGNENYDIMRGVQDNIDILGVDELSEEDKIEEKNRILPRERSRWGLWRIEVARARKIDRFLSQAFQVPEVFASNYGKLVPSSETISGFQEVMAGKFGHKPEVAFEVGNVAEFDNLEQKVEDRKRTTKFKMKKVLCLPVAVPMTEDKLVLNVYFAVDLFVSLLMSLADAVTEKVAGRNQVSDQGGGDQDYAGYALGIGLAKFDDAPDVSGLSFPYERDFGSDEPVLFEVDTSDEVIAMMMAMGTDLF